MNPSQNIFAKNLIGTLCVSADDGQRLHDELTKYIKAQLRVVLSFAGVETLISAFLNAAIGQLYGEFDEKTIEEFLEIKGMEPDDFELLQRVISNAKVYFLNRGSFDDAWKAEENE